jgi:CheY-like chemotaxis protein
MEAAATVGTGAGLAPPGFPIVIKTGTAAEPGRGYHVNYIGLGPWPDPLIAFCVRVTDERTSPSVNRAAREVARRLLTALAGRRSALEAGARRQRRRPPPIARPDGVPDVDDRGPGRPDSSGAASTPSTISGRGAGPWHAGTAGAGEADVGDAKLRILVADDEEGVLFALKEYLGCCGWEVDAVLSPTEAQRLLESRDYAAVITDLRFSGPAGDEGLAVVRAARTRNPDAPVVVMTGYGSPEAEREARRLGVDAFVPKPVPLWELARLVQGWAAAG